MIIDYDFRGKRVTIVGGGHETARKIRLFQEAGAHVRLVGPPFDPEGLRTARRLRVPVLRVAPTHLARRAFEATDVVAVIADDSSLGRRLRPIATRRRVMFYVSDSPELGDWIQPAIRSTPPLTIAVSTGGNSPIVARTLADRLLKDIRPEDRLMANLQDYARHLARSCISDSSQRRNVLHRIFVDPAIREALHRGDVPRAKALTRQVVLAFSRRRRRRRAAHA